MRAKGLTSLFQRADIHRADIRTLSLSLCSPQHPTSSSLARALQLLTFRVEPARIQPVPRRDSTRARLPREHNEINERRELGRGNETASRNLASDFVVRVIRPPPPFSEPVLRLNS